MKIKNKNMKKRSNRPLNGHFEAGLELLAWRITPKQMRKDHAKAFMQVAIMVNKRRSLGRNA